MNERKIEISFDSRYSREQRSDIINILQGKFGVVNQPEKALLFPGAIDNPTLLIVIALIAISLESFLKGFFSESGRKLARILFSPKRKHKRIDSLKLKIVVKHKEEPGIIINHKPQRIFYVTAENTDELYSQIEMLLTTTKKRQRIKNPRKDSFK
jgi:hypothetical protein